MPQRQRHYSIFSPPSLSMTELIKTTLDHDSTDMLIERWLEHTNTGLDAYQAWFKDARERMQKDNTKQTVAWNKGEFAPEHVFCRTVDTNRLMPLDRTWTTHVYHHHSMQDRKRSMMPVVFTMVCCHFVCSCLLYPQTSLCSSQNSCYCVVCMIPAVMKYMS